MKFIHTADLHLGSKMDSKISKLKADERSKELRTAFLRMVEYAEKNVITAILISGDLFDENRPTKKDKEFFYSVVKGNPQIDFIYLRGNHDGLESFTEDGIENLKTFSSSWSYYNFDDVCIAGIELQDGNISSFYSTLKLDEKKKNIVMLHGEAYTSENQGKINLQKLKERNIDYLALGHIHSFSGVQKLDDRGVYAYSGCLEGRGFDEVGDKGFIVLDIGDKITAEFVENSIRKIHQIEIDITGTNSDYEAYNVVKSALRYSKDDLIEIILSGSVSFDTENIEEEIKKRLDGEYYFISVKNKIKKTIDINAYISDRSLKGEFVREVMASENLSDDEKAEIITIGLKALSKRGNEI